VPDDRDTFTITFDGDPVAVVAGQTIAAALIASGRSSWRTTRGLFCGIGACFDCLVTVNGTRSARACLITAAAGDVVVSERADHGDRTN
jgi:predicted molibdopterin-dependent oxidoreductase YjgC